ncbi:hypothetical protein EAF00_003187 [Botryotinia globosa]|nr:hypothetical protein EAF00_003187 [Botryotinia globosa]
MSIAILSGIPSSVNTPQVPRTIPPITSEKSTSSKFIACIRRPESAKKVRQTLSPYLLTSSITILQNENVLTVQRATVIVLACKPYTVNEIISKPDMAQSPSRRSSSPNKQKVSPTSHPPPTPAPSSAHAQHRFQIRESMTVINISTSPLPESATALLTRISTRIDRVVFLPSSSMHACTALCGSSPVFFALMLAATTDDAVAMGLPRAEAQKMAAQTMRGVAGLILLGEHPALLGDKVSTPSACTIGGLWVLEERRVRGTAARALREAKVVAGRSERELERELRGLRGRGCRC